MHATGRRGRRWPSNSSSWGRWVGLLQAPRQRRQRTVCRHCAAGSVPPACAPQNCCPLAALQAPRTATPAPPLLQRFYQKYVEREIVNHRLLAHPHIVGFKEVFVTQKVGPILVGAGGQHGILELSLSLYLSACAVSCSPPRVDVPPTCPAAAARAAAPCDCDGVCWGRQPAAVCGGGGAAARVAGTLLLPAAHTGAAGAGWAVRWAGLVRWVTGGSLARPRLDWPAPAVSTPHMP
jgi:hypothetical protein